jgi:hypothetical protein
MIKLDEIGNLIEKMEKIVGDGCRISLRVPFPAALQFEFFWLVGENHHMYRYIISNYELQSVHDPDVLLDLITIKARYQYQEMCRFKSSQSENE